MRDVLVGTAGHIDHGKTTLVKALTGIDADRLQEEKRRGITIDIGFAWMQLGDLRVGFVDLPGHEKFVKNMLAGVGGIQFVLLIIAADESVMPQTVEHFRICQLLEIPRGMIVLTKAAVTDPELVELVKEEARDLVSGTFLEGAPILAVDSVQGQGVEEMKEVFGRQMEKLPHLDNSRKIFRMPIDRVFSSRGFGTIVTGTPLAGVVTQNETLLAYPGSASAKVRSIQVFGENEEQATAGQRTALNLASLERSDLERGMVLAPARSFDPSPIVDVSIRALPDAPAAIAHRDPIRFHHGSAEVMGRIALLGKKELLPGERGLAQLRLDQSVLTCSLDHFVLRRYSPMTTIAGGVVLDPVAPKHRKKDLASVLPELERLQSSWLEQKRSELTFLQYFIAQAGLQGASVSGLASRIGLTPAAVLALLEESDDHVAITPEAIVARSRIQELKVKVVDFLRDYHGQNPLHLGASQEELKNRTMPRVNPALAQSVLEGLQESGVIVHQQGLLRSCDWTVDLSLEQEEIRRQIVQQFQPQTLATPSLPSVLEGVSAPESATRDIYFYLIQSGELVRVSGDVVLSRNQLEWMLEKIRDSFQAGDSFGVAEFKNLFGISRKFAIPYLEFLDRTRITRRMGDQRLVL